jgi:DNA sulfur modification protein DndD
MRAGQLLDGGNLINVIRENINNVMGFNKYDQISQAARKVQEDYTKERLDNEQMQKEYSALVESRQKLIDENQALDLHLKKLREFAVVHLDDYQKAKTGKQTEDNLQQKIRTTEEKIETVNAGAQNFLERVAKLHQELETDIFVPHLASLQKAALNIVLRSKQELENRKKNHLDENKIREVVYAAFDEAAKADPNVKKLDKELIAAAVINRYTDVSSSDEYVFLDDEEVSALRNMYDRPTQNNFPDLDTERKRQNVEMESLPQLREQLDVFRRQLSGDDFAIISSYETNEAEIKNTETAIAQNDAEIKKLSNQIESYDIQIQQEPDLKYDTLVKLPDLFNRISKKLLEQKRHSIEQLMKDELNINLISHQGVIGRVELGNDMALKIFHQNGNEIFLSQLNAGAKQIVIQVLLKVLRKQGDYEPPIMIDTVMGVLDKESRDSVIENYFPSLGEQSILLSTNTEITPENDYPKLEAHIAKTYTLVRDKEKQLTNVVPGYFGRQLNQE